MADVLSGTASGAAAGAGFGPWGAVIGGALGAGSSLIGANKASKSASSAMEQQKQLQQADLAFRQQMYADEKALYGPLRQQLVNQAMSDKPLGFDVASGQIRQAYGDMNRRALGLGYTNPGSGLMQSSLRSGRLNMASDIANAYQRGMDARRQLGLVVSGGNQINQLGQGVTQGLGQMGQFYGQQAAQYNQAAQQGWQNFGQGLQGIAYSLPYMMRGSQQQVSPVFQGAMNQPAQPIANPYSQQMPLPLETPINWGYSAWGK